MPQIPPINFAGNGFESVNRPDRQSRLQTDVAQPTNTISENRQNTRDVRLSPAISANRNLSELENDSRIIRSQQQAANQSPVGQYQLNQDILKREEIDQLIGIDIFA